MPPRRQTSSGNTKAVPPGVLNVHRGRLQTELAPSDQADLGPPRSECADYGPADPPASARHDDHLTGRSHHLDFGILLTAIP